MPSPSLAHDRCNLRPVNSFARFFEHAAALIRALRAYPCLPTQVMQHLQSCLAAWALSKMGCGQPVTNGPYIVSHLQTGSASHAHTLSLARILPCMDHTNILGQRG